MAAQMVEGHRKDKLKHIDPKTIIIGERFREDYGNDDTWEDFKDSIKNKGLIQPISVDSELHLLAGGRRTRAVLELALPTVPVIMRDVADEIDARELELFENIHRKDFTWAERAKLTEKINKLYTDKHGEGNWSGRKTAELLDKGVATVARELQLANAIKLMPELAELKTADEALKLLKKMEDDAIVDELRRRQVDRMDAPVHVDNEDHGNAKTNARNFQNGLRTMLRMADQNYIISDVFKGMEGLRSNGNIQIIECDPPYGIDLNQQKGSKNTITSNVHTYEEVEREDYPNFVRKLCSELYRVAGKDCWLVFWYGPTWHQLVLESLREAGWQVDEIPAIWAKTQGQTLQPEVYLARGYEPFFLCRKGKPVMVERGRLNVFNFPGVAGKSKYHPTQRPTELIKEIFSTIGAGRQHVFVPFLGSGATLLTCYDMGFQGFGFDLNGEYKDKFMLAVEDQTRKLFDSEE